MKTRINLLLACGLLLAFQNTLNAQVTEGKPRFGIKIGVNGANLYDDANADDKKSRIGFTGGAFVKFPIVGGKLTLRPELLFVTKGGSFDYTNGTRPNIKLSYVELPLSLELRLLGFLNLHGGMQAALLANADGKIVGNTQEFGKDHFESLDYGWHLGGGLDIGNIGLHLRISRGLNEISKDDSLQSFVGKLKNSAWTLSFSAGF